MSKTAAPAAYVRVSSDKQDVARQRDSINQWTDRSGETISLWFEDSQGRNPRDLASKRQGFQRMLKAVEAGLVSCIVVDSQDRFGTRDAYEWGKFLTLLRDNGCALFDASGKELSADDDAAVLTGTLGALTSTREQKEKAHRNVTGKVRKAKLGEYQGGNPPYGFDVVCFGADGNEKWRSVYVGHYKRRKVYPDGREEIFDGKDNSPRKDPTDTLYVRPTIKTERLKAAKDIFEWYAAESISPQQIGGRLNKLKGDPVFGEAWHKVTISQLLRNPVYIGLPTWNKQASSRFVEFVGGQIKPVEKIGGKVKQGRDRKPADYVQPDKPQFPPVVKKLTWDKVQAKLAAASQGPKKPAQVGELWLRPFLVCGHCGKPMHSMTGKGTRGLYPSYFCATYNKYGKENLTGCFCHRVKHDQLAEIVTKYVERTAPKVAELLRATAVGDLEAARPLLQAVNSSAESAAGLQLDIMHFVEDQATKHELRGFYSDGRAFEEIYGVLFERVRPSIDRQIAEREAKLDAMLEQYGDLQGALRERVKAMMEAIQAEIDQLRAQLKDLREPWADLQAELVARREAFAEAVKALSGGSAGRQKTEAIAGVIDKVVCRFSHVGKKSHLESVEIVPIVGEPACFTDGITPGPDLSPPYPAAAQTRYSPSPAQCDACFLSPPAPGARQARSSAARRPIHQLPLPPEAHQFPAAKTCAAWPTCGPVYHASAGDTGRPAP